MTSFSIHTKLLPVFGIAIISCLSFSLGPLAQEADSSVHSLEKVIEEIQVQPTPGSLESVSQPTQVHSDTTAKATRPRGTLEMQTRSTQDIKLKEKKPLIGPADSSVRSQEKVIEQIQVEPTPGSLESVSQPTQAHSDTTVKTTRPRGTLEMQTMSVQDSEPKEKKPLISPADSSLDSEQKEIDQIQIKPIPGSSESVSQPASMRPDNATAIPEALKQRQEEKKKTETKKNKGN